MFVAECDAGHIKIDVEDDILQFFLMRFTVLFRADQTDLFTSA